MGRKKLSVNVGETINPDGTYTRLYRIYTGMKSRCYDINQPAYCHYGGKGIDVCETWKNDFTAFKRWAETNGYDDSLTIDRIDNEKGYSPENCRWATRLEQTRNRTTTWNVTIEGVTKTAAEWCEIHGIKHTTARERKRQGWDDVSAVTKKARKRRTE